MTLDPLAGRDEDEFLARTVGRVADLLDGKPGGGERLVIAALGQKRSVDSEVSTAPSDAKA